MTCTIGILYGFILGVAVTLVIGAEVSARRRWKRQERDVRPDDEVPR